MICIVLKLKWGMINSNGTISQSCLNSDEKYPVFTIRVNADAIKFYRHAAQHSPSQEVARYSTAKSRNMNRISS